MNKPANNSTRVGAEAGNERHKGISKNVDVHDFSFCQTFSPGGSDKIFILDIYEGSLQNLGDIRHRHE